MRNASSFTPPDCMATQQQGQLKETLSLFETFQSGRLRIPYTSMLQCIYFIDRNWKLNVVSQNAFCWAFQSVSCHGLLDQPSYNRPFRDEENMLPESSELAWKMDFGSQYDS